MSHQLLTGRELMKRWDVLPLDFIELLKKGLLPYDGTDLRVLDEDRLPHFPPPTFQEIFKFICDAYDPPPPNLTIEQANRFRIKKATELYDQSRNNWNKPVPLYAQFSNYPASDTPVYLFGVGKLGDLRFEVAKVESFEREHGLVHTSQTPFKDPTETEANEQSPSKPENYMWQDDDTWLISFRGSPQKSFTNLFGLRYISYVLKRPRQKINVKEIEDRFRKDPSGVDSKIRTIAENGFESRGSIDDDWIGAESKVADKNSRKIYLNELDRLSDKLEAAKDTGNEYKVGKIQEEMKAFANELHRKPDPYRRCRERVGKNIYNAKEALKNKIPSLHSHLKYFLKVKGTYCTYQPDEPFEWDIKYF